MCKMDLQFPFVNFTHYLHGLHTIVVNDCSSASGKMWGWSSHFKLYARVYWHKYFTHRDNQGLVGRQWGWICSLTSKKQQVTNLNHWVVMMLWRQDDIRGRTCSMHIRGINIRTIKLINYLLTKKPPIRAPCQLVGGSQPCCSLEWMNRALIQATSPQCLITFVHHIWSVHWSNENASC